MRWKETDCTFLVYIDESGDEGFTWYEDGTGSSEWFVNSAVIIRRSIELETVKLVARVKELLNKPPEKPLHFRNLKHNQRIPYVREIAEQRLRTVSVMVHKPSISSPETFRNGHRLYWYTVRYVLERVSWYCRDILSSHDQGDGSAYLIFSNRRNMSYGELRTYLLRLKLRDAEDVRIDWDVVRRDQFSPIPHSQMMGLRVADAVASSTYMALDLDGYGNNEPRYARTLEPVLYHYNGRRWGYGAKVWPREAESMVRKAGGERYRWLKDIKN